MTRRITIMAAVDLKDRKARIEELLGTVSPEGIEYMVKNRQGGPYMELLAAIKDQQARYARCQYQRAQQPGQGGRWVDGKKNVPPFSCSACHYSGRVFGHPRLTAMLSPQPHNASWKERHATQILDE